MCYSYGPEGIGTTCSVQWHQRTASSRSYIICLFIFCLLLPLLVMIFCYGRILLALRAVSLRVRASRTCSPPFAEGGGSDCCTFCDLQVGGASGERRESRVLQMVVCMVAGYLLCWMPYGAVAMLASFGPPGAVPPTASLIPSLLAKTSTVLNPVIYVRLNHQVVMATLFALIKRNHSPLFLNERLSVLQVLLVHDRLELRGLSHPGQPDGFSLPGGVVTSSQLARPGAKSCSCHVENTAGFRFKLLCMQRRSQRVTKSVTVLGCF